MQTALSLGLTDVIPVIPPNAPLAEDSRVDPEQLGKVPGDYARGGWDTTAGWPEMVVDNTSAARWDSLGANVGLKCGYNYVALDIDILADTTMMAVRQALIAAGVTAPVRVGKAPKALWLFRVAGEPISRRQYPIKTQAANGEWVRAVIDVMGVSRKMRPTQCVIFGTHPSGVAYTWDKWPRADQLPTITQEGMDLLVEVVLGVTDSQGWQRGRPSSAGGSGAGRTSALGLPTDMSLVTDILNILPNPDMPWDDYVRVGMLIQTLLGEDEGWPYWEAWCKRSGKYEPNETERRWLSLEPEGNMTFGSLVQYARDLGVMSLQMDVRVSADHKWRSALAAGMPEVPTPYVPPEGAHPKTEVRPMLVTPTDVAEKFRDMQPLELDKRVKVNPADMERNVRSLVDSAFTYDGKRTLIWWMGDFYQWGQTHWEMVSKEWVEDVLFHWISKTMCVEKEKKVKGEIVIERTIIAATRPTVTNYVAALRAVTGRPQGKQMGWPDGRPGTWQAVQNGILDLDTGKLLMHDPEFFNLTWVDAPWDPDAAIEGTRMASYLRDMLVWDDQILAMQEVLGYALSGETNLQKSFMPIGKKRCGKGTLMRLIKSLVGGQFASIRSTELGKSFALENTIGKSVLAVPDVRLSKESDFAAIAEMLLTISGEDDVDISRKHKPAWQGKTTVRLFLLSNSVPQFRDGDGVLASRFIYFMMPNSFYGKEDIGLLDTLLTERAAILKWAVDGWRRLDQQGRFTESVQHQKLMASSEIRMDPVGKFIEQWFEVTGSDNDFLPTAQLFYWFGEFCAQNEVGPWSMNGFSKTLASKPLNISRTSRENGTVRGFLGIRIKDK
ncbi:phage/plasmid primase, P4 family [Falsiruegeria mediterranea]